MGDHGAWWTLAAVGALVGVAAVRAPGSSPNLRTDGMSAFEALVARDRKLARIAKRIQAV